MYIFENSLNLNSKVFLKKKNIFFPNYLPYFMKVSSSNVGRNVKIPD